MPKNAKGYRFYFIFFLLSRSLRDHRVLNFHRLTAYTSMHHENTTEFTVFLLNFTFRSETWNLTCNNKHETSSSITSQPGKCISVTRALQFSPLASGALEVLPLLWGREETKSSMWCPPCSCPFLLSEEGLTQLSVLPRTTQNNP